MNQCELMLAELFSLWKNQKTCLVGFARFHGLLNLVISGRGDEETNTPVHVHSGCHKLESCITTSLTLPLSVPFMTTGSTNLKEILELLLLLHNFSSHNPHTDTQTDRSRKATTFVQIFQCNR